MDVSLDLPCPCSEIVLTYLSCSTRLAEFASIILCTCFPMMPRLAKLVVDRRARSKSSTRTLWKRAKSGNSESGELGDVHHPRPSEEVVTGLDGRSEASQQNWNPIKA